MEIKAIQRNSTMSENYDSWNQVFPLIGLDPWPLTCRSGSEAGIETRSSAGYGSFFLHGGSSPKKNPMSIFPALKILARMLHLDLIRENEFIGPKDVLIGVFIVLLICIPFNVDIDWYSYLSEEG